MLERRELVRQKNFTIPDIKINIVGIRVKYNKI